jgi:hypothetical protein
MFLKPKGEVIWNLRKLITDILLDNKEERAEGQKIKCCLGPMVNRALRWAARPIIKLEKKMKTQTISMMQS